jgi:RNA polymerase sigma-70 factor, ECF subfamily
VVHAELLPMFDAGGLAEADTIGKACRGDQHAFEQLYRTHVARVFALCLRMTCDRAHAQDCTQEAFVAAWRALPKFERRSRFSSWLHRIAVNIVLSHRAQIPRAQIVCSEEYSEELSALAGSADAADSLDLERAIAHLPQGARDVLVLVGIYGHSHDEAADMLGIAAGTSKAQLHRARALLASQLGLSSAAL